MLMRRHSQGSEISGCFGKRAHLTYAAAMGDVRNLLRHARDNREPHTRIEPYLCRFCGFWHVGNGVVAPKRERVLVEVE